MMIYPIELQKGNVVAYNNEIFNIESIDSMNGRTDVSLINLTQDAFNREISTTIEKLVFVPLRREIFELLDFEIFIDPKRNTFYNFKNFEDFFLVNSNGCFDFRVRSTRKIYFVHELQNICFILTENKLDIKNLSRYFI
jgi:hypothetical protein